MPTFVLTSPEGKQYKVNAPEGATVEQAFEYLKQSEPSAFEPKGKTVTGIKPELGDLSGMPDMKRRTYRVPSQMALRDLAEKAGGASEMYGQIAAAVGSDIARIPGGILDVATMAANISPSTLLGITPKVEPVGIKTTNELLDLKQTPAAYAPYGFAGSVVGPQAVGAAVGAPIRAGVAVANKLQKYFNPKFSNYLAAAENKGPEIVDILRNAKEFVPGSKPTTAQALTNTPLEGAEFTRFASLQPRGVGNIPEEVRTAYNVRRAEQEAAREEAVNRVGGTPKGKQVMEEVRSELTDPLYDAARKGVVPVDTGPILDKIDDIIKNNPGNSELLTEMQRIRKGLVIPETPVAPELARTKAQEVVSSLDGIKTALAKKENTFIVGELTDIKNMLVKAIPGMEDAQAAFAQASEPINRMNIGTYLKKALTGALPAGTERAGAYATALENAPATIKKSTGMARFKSLEDAGVPKPDIDTLNAVADDLNRSLAAEKLQSRGGGAIPKDPNAIQIEMLNRTATFVNKVVATVANYVGRKKAIDIALEMLDPKVAAKVLEQAMNMEKAQTARSAAAATISPAIETAGIIAAPINALAPPSQNNLAGR